MSPTSLTAAALPWLVVAWVITVAVVALLIYLIVRAVLSKTEPQRLPEVLCALGPLVKSIAEALARPPTQLMKPRDLVWSAARSRKGGSLDVQLPNSVNGRKLLGVGNTEEDHSMPIEDMP